MANAQDLKAAGFTDEEISKYVSGEAQKLTAAGFTSKEISDYLGVQPSLAAPQPQARVAKGWGDAWSAGYQRSLAGLIDRGKLPEVEIDAKHNDWFERNIANFSQAFNETPEMVAGMVAGMFATRSKYGAAAGAGYAPAVIRTAYADAIRDGKITDTTGFWKGTTIVAPYLVSANAQKQGLKEAAINTAVVAAGAGAGKLASPYMGAAGTAAAVLGAEYATAVTAPAALEGRLPEAHEWLDGAVQVIAPKGAAAASKPVAKAITSAPQVARNLMETWRRTGIPPEQVVADAASNPSIRADLTKGTGAEQVLRDEVKKQGFDVQEIDPGTVDLSMFGFDETGKPARTGPNRIATDSAWEAKDFDRNVNPSSTDLAALRSNIEKNGFDDSKPITITVSTADGLGYVTDGNNRLAAAKALGLPDVPYKVELTDVPFTEAQRAKAKTVDQLGLTKDDLLPKEKSPEVLAAEAELRRLLGEDAPPEIPRAYREQAARMAAEEAFSPDSKARKVLDTPMAELPQTKLPHQLNLEYIEAPDDIKALYTKMSETYKADIENQRNGFQSWAATEAKAREQLTGLLGPDARRILEGRKPGDPVSTVELAIRSDMLMQATVDASAAIEAWRKADPETRAANEAAALSAIYKLGGIQSELIGARAEAARALNIAKATKLVQQQTGDVAKMVELYGKDPKTMLEMLSDMQTPEQLSRAAAGATQLSPFRTFIDHYYRPGLMSGFLTVGYNIAGNASRMLLRNFAIEPVAAVGNLLRAPENRTTTMSDVAARWYGTYVVAPRSMIRAAADAFQHDGVTGPAKAAWQAGKENMVDNSPAGALGSFSRAVYGTNSMLDTMFRELNTQGSLWSEATATALKEGHEIGTQAFTERVRDLVANPTDAMVETANREATASVFATPGGKILQAYNKLSDAAPILNFFTPFRQTPANMFKDTFRLTPFAPLIDTWQADIKAGGARRDRAVAEVAVGAALIAAGYGLAAEGKLTGGLDPDPKKRAVQLQSGMQPYSYKMNDGTYVPLVKVAPQVGTLLGMTADMVQLQQYMTPEEQHRVGQAAVLTFKNAVTNQTMLAGVTNVLKAMDDEHSFEKYVNSTAGSMVPASGMMGQIAALKDPYQREVYSMLDAVKQRVPVARETLQPKIDAWGEKIKELERPAFVAPIKPSQESTDRVRTEAARLGVSVSKPPKTLDVGINQGRIGLVELTAEQKTKYAETAGRLAYDIVAPQVNSPVWDTLPDILQREAFQDALTQGRELANATTLDSVQLEQEVRTRAGRLMELLQMKQPK